MKFTNIAIRISGVVLFGVTASFFAFEISREISSERGKLLSPAIFVSFFFVTIVGIPGILVAVKGPLQGGLARENRRAAVQTVLALGLALLVITLLWPAGMAMFEYLFPLDSISRWDAFLSNLYDRLLFCAALWTILISLGLASLLSGRNLFCK